MRGPCGNKNDSGNVSSCEAGGEVRDGGGEVGGGAGGGLRPVASVTETDTDATAKADSPSWSVNVIWKVYSPGGVTPVTLVAMSVE